MTVAGWLQIAAFCLILVALTKPMGVFLFRVFEGERTLLTPVVRPVERLLYKLGGVDEAEDMNWGVYALALLAFSVVTLVLTFALLRLQGICRLIHSILARRR